MGNKVAGLLVDKSGIDSLWGHQVMLFRGVAKIFQRGRRSYCVKQRVLNRLSCRPRRRVLLNVTKKDSQRWVSHGHPKDPSPPSLATPFFFGKTLPGSINE